MVVGGGVLLQKSVSDLEPLSDTDSDAETMQAARRQSIIKKLDSQHQGRPPSHHIC